MSAGELDLLIEQGATFQKKLIWQDADGNPIDITNYTGRMQVRESKDATVILVELTTVNGRITIGGANGEIDLEIDATTTAALTFSSAVYDLELEDTGGIVTRLVEGKVKLSFEVTR